MKALLRVLKELNYRNNFNSNIFLENEFNKINFDIKDLIKGKLSAISSPLCKITIEDNKKSIERVFVLRVGIIYNKKYVYKIKLPINQSYSRNIIVNLFLIINLYSNNIFYLINNRENKIIIRDIDYAYSILKYYCDFNKNESII